MMLISNDDIKEKLLRYQYHPVEFIKDGFKWGEKGTFLEDKSINDWQLRYLYKLGDFANSKNQNLKLAVGAGNGVGKTMTMCFVVLWCLLVHNHVRIIITSSRESQLRSVVWDTLQTIMSLCKYKFLFSCSAMRVVVKGQENQRSILLVPWSENRPEGIAGTHMEHNMIIFDEASAIASPVWEAANGAFSTGKTYFLAFGNITRSSGNFYNIFTSYNPSWDKMHVSCLECEHINREFIENSKQEYGEESHLYRVYILGLWPLHDSEGLFDMSKVEEACRKTMVVTDILQAPPIYMGVDVAAGTGGDFSVIIIRKGFEILYCLRTNRIKIPDFIDEILRLYYQYQVDMVAVDAASIGTGMFQILERKNIRALEVWGNARPLKKRRSHYNLRAELFDEVKAWFASGLVALGEFKYRDLLKEELSGITSVLDKGKFLKIHSKAEMKKLNRTAKSPDVADALSYSFYPELLGFADKGNDTRYNDSIECVFANEVF